MNEVPFWRKIEEFANREALVWQPADGPMQRLSYSELAERADAFAKVLEQGSRRLLIAIAMAPEPAVIAAYLGALRGEHVVVLIDDSVLDDDHPMVRQFNFDLRVASDGQDDIRILRGQASDTELHPDLAILLSTSGSTGEPKLVRISASAVNANAASIVEYLGVTAESRAIVTLPLFYSYGMSVLHSQLAAGGALILTDASVIDAAFWELAQSAKASNLALVPFQVQLIEMSDFREYPLPTLACVTQAGGKLAPVGVARMASLAEAGGWRFFVMYGQTEASPRISYVPPEMLPAAADTVGRAIPGGKLAIRAEDGEPISEPGVQGELVYNGPNVMMGYATTQADLGREAETRELLTGDLAEWTADGLVRIVGRLKRFIKLYGMRISLDHVEALLAETGVTAYVTGVDDQLVVFISSDVDVSGVEARLAKQLDVPATGILAAAIDAPPLLSSGKVDHGELKKTASELIAKRSAPDSKLGKDDLRTVFAEATRTSEVQNSDSFMTLGGDSLAFLTVTLAIEDKLGRVPDGWEEMPLAQILALEPAKRARSQLEMDVIVRILGVTLIIVNHTVGVGFTGGSWVLLIAAGMSFYRFQVPAVSAVGGVRSLYKMLYPLLPLYFITLAALDVAGRHVPMEMWLLVANLGENENAFHYNVNWFISLYAQLVVIVVGTMLIPKMGAFAASGRFRFATAFFGVGLAMSLLWQGWLYGYFDGVDHNLQSIFRVGSPLTCIPLIGLGFMIAVAESVRERAIVLVAVIVNAIVFPTLSASHFAVILVSGGLLLSGWTVSVPKLVGRTARQMASAALFVYLLHPLVLHALKYMFNVVDDLGPYAAAVIAVPLSFIVSWVGLEIFRRVERVAFRMLPAFMTKRVA